MNGGPEGKDWREGETSYTLDTQHKSQAVANDQGIDDKVAYTLDRANGQAVSYMETVGALCARDHKGIGSQYVQEGKVLAFPSVMAHGQGGAEIREGQARCLTCNEAPILFEHHMQDSRVKGPLSVSPQLNAKAGTGGGNIPLVMEVQTQYGDKAGTLTARHDSSPCADRGANVVTTFGCCHQAGGDVRGINLLSERAHTLQAGQQQSVVQSIVLPINTMTVQGRPSDDINPRMGSGIGGIGDPCPTITKGHSHAVCFAQNQEGELRTSSIANTVTTSGNATARGTGKLLSSSVVRRLTPAECEKLQAFPVGWTQIPYRGKPAEQCPDGPRYKALGNSWAVCCARWIFERIAKVDAL